MNIGLLSHHADFSTNEYFARAISHSGCELLRIGPVYPHKAAKVAPSFTELLHGQAIDLLLFVDPSGPVWPLGFESLPCPKAAYLIDVHMNLRLRLTYAPFFDFLFVAQKDYVAAFHRAGFRNTWWLPLACDPDLHCTDETTRPIDVGFVGQLGAKRSRRHAVLTNVLPQYATNDFTRSYNPADMARLYARSKIVFNTSVNGDLNMRVFEALGSGALLVTDRIDNGLSELFEEDVHYVGYSTIPEAHEKLRYYLAHTEERERIAEAGRARAFAQHTYEDRWRRIRELVATPTSEAVPIAAYPPLRRARTYAKVYEQLKLPNGVWLQMLSVPASHRVAMIPELARASARRVITSGRATMAALEARLRKH